MQDVAAFAIDSLLGDKNENWLEDGETPLTRSQFAARMKLVDITIHADGHLEFWHDDDYMFWGHSILVEGTLAGGLTNVDTPG
jgi:hypothetical protein